MCLVAIVSKDAVVLRAAAAAHLMHSHATGQIRSVLGVFGVFCTGPGAT